MAITDLTGTKWIINSINCTAGYGLFIVGNVIHNDTLVGCNEFLVGYDIYWASTWEQENSVCLGASDIHYGTISVNDIVEFVGTGADLTNPNLIAWLESHATQIKSIIELKPFLTNIANAIRTKKGTTAQINAQNFASEIESIESGGGLVGYSGTINNERGSQYFIAGLKEDGTAVKTFSTSDKYIFIVLFNTSTESTYITGGIKYDIYYGAFRPTQDGFVITIPAGGSND